MDESCSITAMGSGLSIASLFKADVYLSALSESHPSPVRYTRPQQLHLPLYTHYAIPIAEASELQSDLTSSGTPTISS